MAKKKKRKQHRRPVAPPVHSAPEAVHAPPARPAEGYATTRPDSPEPPSIGESTHAAVDFERKPAPSRPRPQPTRKPGKRRRSRTKTRQYVIIGLVVVAIVGAFVTRSIVNGQRNKSFTGITAAAGCGKLKTVSVVGGHEQGVRVKYSTSPPAGGPHDPVPLGAGVYTEAFSTDTAKHPSIYQAVHSLEHAYVIVWYNPNLKASEVDALSKAVTGEPKVILVPYPDLKSTDKMAMSAWGNLQYCGKPSTRAVEAFIKRFRGASSAPEPLNA